MHVNESGERVLKKQIDLIYFEHEISSISPHLLLDILQLRRMRDIVCYELNEFDIQTRIEMHLQ